MVRLPDVAGRKPAQLSGGQRQRVALARAIVNRPRVLLLDEPLGALDLKLREEMQVELKRIQREVGITFVYVTHDQDEALSMSDRLAVFNRGRIEQVGTPAEVYEQPAERVRRRVRRRVERPGARRAPVHDPPREGAAPGARTTPPRASSSRPAPSSTRATPARRRATRSRSTRGGTDRHPQNLETSHDEARGAARAAGPRRLARGADRRHRPEQCTRHRRGSEHEAHHAWRPSRPCCLLFGVAACGGDDNERQQLDQQRRVQGPEPPRQVERSAPARAR